ncbi:MAG: hypothetical protein RXQ68_00095 [Candidatus Nanopusillus sp.]
MMNSQQSDKSSEKISDLIKEENNKMQLEDTTKELKKLLNEIKLEYYIMDLENLLKEAAKKLEERINLPEIKESSTIKNLEESIYTEIKLYCDKHNNEPLQCGYNIKILFDKAYLINENYIKKETIECHSDSQNPSYKIECTKYNDNLSFELYDSSSFIEGIKKSFLSMYKILYPGVPIDMNEQHTNKDTHIDMKAGVFMDFDKPRKENSEIKIYNLSSKEKELEYNNGRVNVWMKGSSFDTF